MGSWDWEEIVEVSIAGTFAGLCFIGFFGFFLYFIIEYAKVTRLHLTLFRILEVLDQMSHRANRAIFLIEYIEGTTAENIENLDESQFRRPYRDTKMGRRVAEYVVSDFNPNGLNKKMHDDLQKLRQSENVGEGRRPWTAGKSSNVKLEMAI
jgi:hypothetical protein